VYNFKAIALIQQKGGSGKTTLATNLAAAACLAGARTLLLDMDRQGSAREWAVKRPEDSPLRAIDVQHVHAERGIDRPQFERLAKGFEVVVLDLPARAPELVIRSALVLATVVVLPVQPMPIDFWASPDTDAYLDQEDAEREQIEQPALPRLYVLSRAIVGSRLCRDGRAAFDLEAHPACVVHQRIAFAEAAGEGSSVLISAPEGLAAAELRIVWRAIERMHGKGTQQKKTKSGRKRSGEPNANGRRATQPGTRPGLR
jgi:chromosome partitioning protein